MPSIMAGEVVEVTPIEGGPTFQIRSIDYWSIQAVLAEDDAAKKIRLTLALGLVAIGGDESAVPDFLERPSVRSVNPLFDAIWEHTWGNSQAG